jgi:predicted nucleotidyltransferase
MQGIDAYLSGWRERARRHDAACTEREERARRLLPSLVTHLVGRYGARRVVLIGSLAEGGFGLDSDIDLAVEGIAGAAIYRAAAELDDLAHPFRVDLVPYEDAHGDLAAKIDLRGLVLHGR